MGVKQLGNSYEEVGMTSSKGWAKKCSRVFWMGYINVQIFTDKAVKEHTQGYLDVHLQGG